MLQGVGLIMGALKLQYMRMQDMVLTDSVSMREMMGLCSALFYLRQFSCSAVSSDLT